jgi:pimeloyl-ACP methyl ester carboxylesterase
MSSRPLPYTGRNWTRVRLLAVAALAIGVAATLVTTAAPPAGAVGGGPTCQQTTVPVNLSATDPTVYHVAGWLCADGSPVGKTAQVLVHGLTYDHRYWDWPGSTQKYSYTRSATDAGYATFAFDRIGDGASDHPTDGSSVTDTVGGYVLHQVIQDLRAGTLGGTTFARVVAVGHSFGSAVVVDEAVTYQDVNGLILTGFAHGFTPNAFAALGSAFYPAPLDPAFANSGLNNTYLTTVPGARTQLFFNPADTSPDVISTDESLKQTATLGELNSVQDPVSLDTTQVTVPILIADGQDDLLICQPSAGLPCTDSATLLNREAANYTPQSCLEAFVLPDSGHDINLHDNAHLWFEYANSWVSRRVGADATHAPTQPCS